MSNVMFLAVAFVGVVALCVFGRTPEHRNPHTQSKKSKWWTRPPR